MMPKVNTLVMALALAACLLAPGASARRLRRSPVPEVTTNPVLPGVQTTASNDASCTAACTGAVQSCKTVCKSLPLSSEALICDTVCEASGAVCNANCIMPKYQVSASASASASASESTTTVPLAVTTAFGRAPATWTKIAARSGAAKAQEAQLGDTCEDLCISAEVACEVACALEIFGEPECGIACAAAGKACEAACAA
eukprot:UC1_evm2s1684